jgi:hypothetical protein
MWRSLPTKMNKLIYKNEQDKKLPSKQIMLKKKTKP